MVSRHKVQRETKVPSVLDDIQLTEEQEKKIHDLAFSKSTTMEEHMKNNSKADSLKKKWQTPSETDEKIHSLNLNAKPKDNDFVFAPADIQDESECNERLQEVMNNISCEKDYK